MGAAKLTESEWPRTGGSLSCILLFEWYAETMNATAEEPKPRNLRELVLQRISSMPESDVAQVYELLLLAEKLQLRAEVSKQAEAESERGTWLDLPEFIAAYRTQKRSA